MSGGEPSSIKRHTRCAAGAPAPSEEFGNRAGAKFDLLVYGLILIITEVAYASSVIQKMASACV